MMVNPVVNFEGIGMCFYRNEGMRPPRAGEFYLSGAIVAAYRAYADLTSHYNVVVPTHRAAQHHGYVRGAPVRKFYLKNPS